MPAGHAAVVVPMPQLGVSVDEGTVIKWHKAVGDEVAVDDPLCDISTDKVDTEIRSPEAGVLARIIVDVGVTVSVGQPLAELTASGQREQAGAPPADQASARTADDIVVDAAAEIDNAREAATTTPIRTSAPQGTEAVVDAVENGVSAADRGHLKIASPVARRVAEAAGIPISAIEGTGLRGRIRKADVLAVVETRAAEPSTAVSASTGIPTSQEHPVELLPRGYQDVPHTLVPLTHQRRAIAEHMTRSRRTAAHMTTEVEVDMSFVASARDALNGRGGVRISYLALIARATCAALAKHPDLNATFAEDHLIHWETVNLGIAVDTEVGLLVPVIQRAERLTAVGLAEAIADLAEGARARHLSPDDVRAGTFTITNPGSVGAVSSMAIINQPQVAILGTPAIVRRPVVVTDAHGSEAIAIRPTMTLALTFDHRAVDGAQATRCLVDIKDRLESWETPAYA